MPPETTHFGLCAARSKGSAWTRGRLDSRLGTAGPAPGLGAAATSPAAWARRCLDLATPESTLLGLCTVWTRRRFLVSAVPGLAADCVNTVGLAYSVTLRCLDSVPPSDLGCAWTESSCPRPVLGASWT